MPLHNPTSNGGYKDLPYSLKLAIVESNCTGCKFLKKHKIENDSESEYGCSYPDDIALLNIHLREPYLTVSEIASNTCDFWQNRTKWELETVDASEGDWNDPATVRKSLRFIGKIPLLKKDGKQVEIGIMPLGSIIEYDELKYAEGEIIPHLQFADNKD